MDWISVVDKLPGCWSQHGSTFASGYVLTFDSYGEYNISQYLKRGEHTSSGWVKLSEGWEGDEQVTHWCELTPPEKI